MILLVIHSCNRGHNKMIAKIDVVLKYDIDCTVALIEPIPRQLQKNPFLVLSHSFCLQQCMNL